ncbi:MAG: hypothetical protein UV38_C0002G0204 [candidate division TM6 bacterium GW2011_GWE2_42_60]|nr:MAG: hypothetical protein UV38_C0002G0204 [candidate division TM6 bacterium GW2011_GWE2_42_60]HBY06044.1 hypothetical protein [Candidatus Dependentiae bacterium]
MEFIRKVAAVCALSFLMAGSAQAVAQIGTFALLKGCIVACKNKVSSWIPESKTVNKQFKKYVVKPASHYAPIIGGVVAEFNPVFGASIAGLGMTARTNRNFDKTATPLSKCLSICYNLFKSGLESGSSLALTRGFVNGNVGLIIAGTLGSFARLGFLALDKGYVTGMYYGLKTTYSPNND